MTLTTTFVPTQQSKDLLCALWVEYGCCGDTRPLLIELGKEIGALEFTRFQRDLAWLMKRDCSARCALGTILRAAIRRANTPLKVTQLRRVYDPPPGQPNKQISSRFD
jgi:hypothetical protein